MSSSADRKFFIGGVAPEANEYDFRSHFEQFGTVVEAKVIRDPFTPTRHRGFGFITFATDEAKAKAFAQEHSIKGKKVELRTMEGSMDGTSDMKRKIFIGGISPSLTKEAIESYFSRIAGVEKVTVMMDPVTNRPRGFGFVLFKDEQDCSKVLQQRSHMITLTDRVDIRPVERRTRQQPLSDAMSNSQASVMPYAPMPAPVAQPAQYYGGIDPYAAMRQPPSAAVMYGYSMPMMPATPAASPSVYAAPSMSYPGAVLPAASSMSAMGYPGTAQVTSADMYTNSYQQRSMVDAGATGKPVAGGYAPHAMSSQADFSRGGSSGQYFDTAGSSYRRPETGSVHYSAYAQPSISRTQPY